MTLARFRTLCLSHPGATEQLQWEDDAVFKLGGKMFAVACTDRARAPDAPVCSFKCDDEGFSAFLERDGVIPAPYLARAKWVALERWDALTDLEIREAVAGSYALVMGRLPKRVRAAIGQAGPPARRTGTRGRVAP
ncbi:MAG: MmcQ/YjbR family DNA-binding protein [Vicinamibacterales bacterium]